MATNLHIDGDLLDEAKRLGRFASKRETVNEALHVLIRRLRQREAIKGFGTVEFRPEFLAEMDRRISGRKTASGNSKSKPRRR